MLLKKITIPAERLHYGRAAGGTFYNDNCSISDSYDTKRSTGTDSKQQCEHNTKPHRLRLLNLIYSRKGFSIIELLITLPIMFFMVYFVVDQWVILSKHQMAEHTMHKYLVRMSVEGRLTSADEAAMINEFRNFSCIVDPATDITATARESKGDARVLRPNMVSLKVTAKPSSVPLTTGKVIGAKTPDSSYRIVVGGSMLSERVNP